MRIESQKEKEKTTSECQRMSERGTTAQCLLIKMKHLTANIVSCAIISPIIMFIISNTNRSQWEKKHTHTLSLALSFSFKYKYVHFFQRSFPSSWPSKLHFVDFYLQYTELLWWIDFHFNTSGYQLYKSISYVFKLPARKKRNMKAQAKFRSCSIFKQWWMSDHYKMH